jgi:hypothetical protein
MRRITILALLLLLAGALAIPARALAQPSAAAAASAAASAGADFDNDGFADLAVGVPGENDFGGAVNVLYGSGAGLTGTGAQVFTGVGGGPIVGSFGSAVAAGDFNNDGFADLAAGARSRRVGGADGAGSVGVLYGSSGGLTTVLDVTTAASEVSRLIHEAHDLNLPVEPGVRPGRDSLVRWAVLLEDVIP